MIILVGGEKGGTGKTTIATNLAAIRAANGFDVLLVDTDVQGSASFWASLREDQEAHQVSCVQKFGSKIHSEIKRLADKFDDIIIDAGGRDSAELRSGMLCSHKFYSPFRPSQFDLWSVERVSRLVVDAQVVNEELKAWAIVNQAPTHSKMTEANEAASFIEETEIGLAQTVVYERIAFQRAARSGLSVAEMMPTDQKAVEEIQSLYREVFNNAS